MGGVSYDIAMSSIEVYTRFDKEIVERMDKIVVKKGYDSRASFIRRAVFDKLNQEEEKFLA